MPSSISAIAVLLLTVHLSGLSPYTVIVSRQETAGAFVHRATGRLVLKLTLKTTSIEHCTHVLTDEGFPAGSDCKKGKSGGAANLTVVLDPVLRAYAALGPTGGGLVFEPGAYEEHVARPEAKALASLTEADVAGWELTPLTKRSPCPVEVDGSRLVYRTPSLTSELAPTWRHAKLSPGCFATGDGWLVVRYWADRQVINGSSDGDSDSVEGWSYALVDASAVDDEWQNTLGLRALKREARAEARSHFEKSLQANPTYLHANFNLACTLSLEKTPFAEGKTYLEAILADPALRAKYRKKIQQDPDLGFWRADPAFAAWLSGWK